MIIFYYENLVNILFEASFWEHKKADFAGFVSRMIYMDEGWGLVANSGFPDFLLIQQYNI